MGEYNRYTNFVTYEERDSEIRAIPYIHDYYGTIKAILLDGDTWFFVSDVACMLGYCLLPKSIIELVSPRNKQERDFWILKGQDGCGYSRGCRSIWLVNFNGVKDLVKANADDVDEKAVQWIIKEVAGSIKRCGYLRDYRNYREYREPIVNEYEWTKTIGNCIVKHISKIYHESYQGALNIIGDRMVRMFNYNEEYARDEYYERHGNIGSCFECIADDEDYRVMFLEASRFIVKTFDLRKNEESYYRKRGLRDYALTGKHDDIYCEEDRIIDGVKLTELPAEYSYIDKKEFTELVNKVSQYLGDTKRGHRQTLWKIYYSMYYSVQWEYLVIKWGALDEKVTGKVKPRLTCAEIRKIVTSVKRHGDKFVQTCEEILANKFLKNIFIREANAYYARRLYF